MPNPTRDELRTAAEIEIAVNDPGDRSVFFARALLAYMEREEKLLATLYSIEKWWRLPNEARTIANIEEPMRQIMAAIKAIEEGR